MDHGLYKHEYQDRLGSYALDMDSYGFPDEMAMNLFLALFIRNGRFLYEHAVRA